MLKDDKGAKMFILRNFKKLLAIVLASAVTAALSIYIYAVVSIPGELILLEGKDYTYDFRNPFPYTVSADKEGLLKFNGDEINVSGSNVNFSRPVSISPARTGSVKLKVQLFGLMTVKVMHVDIVNTKEVLACGNAIGVKLKTDGIMVIGIGDVEKNDGETVTPSKDSGIEPGAIIFAINGKKTDSIDELVKEINKSNGNPVSIDYIMDNQKYQAKISPVKSKYDNVYRIGLWVKEDTAGIGTLTFIDPDNNYFGALGHGITDAETGLIVPIERGEILESSILGVRVGKAGAPGELKGVFNEDSIIGIIKKNTEYGIYGKISNNAEFIKSLRRYPISLRSEIKEGPAYILSNIEGRKVKKYSVEIQKVSRHSINGTKGMVIKVTDKDLLSATGGIVQGMSGSPIIQNGKLVGAVTHVLVNDPTRGYGIFIEAMIRNIIGNIGA